MFEQIGRNDPCWCQSGKKYKDCHAVFDSKVSAFHRQGHLVPSRDLIKNPKQLQGMRESSKISISVLDMVGEIIKPGITTEDINRFVHEKTLEMGGIPAPLNYEGFPKSVCTSLNEEVCHGIPSSSIVLQDGDIINIDVSTIYKGYFSDSSRMFLVGKVSEEKKKLVDVARECIDKGLSMVKPWHFLGDVGHAVHQHALSHGYSVVREIGGHGIGLSFHEDPWVSFVSDPGTEMLMVPGMTFTIEPMINMGTDEIFEDENNGWTIYTADKMPSAQWEVTVLVTEDGYEILTY